MRLGPLTRPDLIFPDLPATDCSGLLRAFADRVAAAGLVRDAEELWSRLLEREKLGSTGIGRGVAIPHCKLAGLGSGIVAIGLAHGGVDFGAPDGAPVSVFFLVISPPEAPAEHLQTLATISRWIRADRHTEALRDLEAPQAIWDFLQESG
ncbi:MAG TPA: PTS sugar transporter subunit IIA [Thermoanaerobaculia bacterium]|nr:PTS sugar transporter subunit IIA [Thermoanaerobaculia bacterium]